MTRVSSWGVFEAQARDLAVFGAERLAAAPAYLATLRRVGAPRVHPVAPIIGVGRLFVFMEPTSPKARDLRERGWYALHNGVPDTSGTGGEFFVSGQATVIDDPELRTVAGVRGLVPTGGSLHPLRVGDRRSSLQRLWRRSSSGSEPLDAVTSAALARTTSRDARRLAVDR